MNDFLPKQPNQTEKMMAAMYNELQGNLLNLSKQLRAIAIATKVDPKEFVKAFKNGIDQQDFINQIQAEENALDEAQEERVDILKNQSIKPDILLK